MGRRGEKYLGHIPKTYENVFCSSPFIKLFSRYVLSLNYVICTVLGNKDVSMDKTICPQGT